MMPRPSFLTLQPTGLVLSSVSGMSIPCWPPQSGTRRAAMPVVTLLITLAITSAQAAGADLAKNLEFVPCSIGNDTASVAAECATLNVPVVRDDLRLPAQSTADLDNPADNTIDLHVARLPAREARADSAPVTLLAGGPGQAASEAFPAILQAFRHLRQNHDLILVDQRGTGQSAPLACPPSSTTLMLDFDAAESARLSQECLDQLSHDPRWFTTSVAVADLDQVRQVLGYDAWHVYGVSYGTRVAMHYARRYPDNVKSLILDAVVPPGTAIGEDVIATGDAALQAIFDRCAADSGCHAAFPSIASDTESLLDDLAARPRQVFYEDVAAGEQQTLEFTDQHLSITLRLLSYSAYGASILPSLLSEAIDDNYYAPLARLTALQVKSLGNSLTTGMYNAVICSEDAPLLDATPATPTVGRYLRTDVTAQLDAACGPWSTGVVDSDIHDPFKSDIPTLVLSGSADPITPPQYGENIVQHLTNARHLVNEGQGHTQAPFGCMPQLIAEFITHGAPQDMDIECLSRLKPPAFFVDANGPLP